MNIFKRLFTALLLTASLLVVPAAAFAAVNVVDPSLCDKSAAEVPAICQDINTSKSAPNPIYGKDGILTKVVNILSMVVGIISVIVIIIAGIRMSTSQGNSQTINSARNQIIYAAIGIVVTVLAQGIVALVLSKI